MQKYLLAAGVTLSAAAVVLFTTLAASASPGDCIGPGLSGPTTLTAPQRASAATCITTIWASAVPANLTTLHCYRQDQEARCFYREATTYTYAEAVGSVILGRIKPSDCSDIGGGSISCESQSPAAQLIGPGAACIGSLANSIWGLDPQGLTSFSLSRTGAVVTGKAEGIQVLSPAQCIPKWLLGEIQIQAEVQ